MDNEKREDREMVTITAKEYKRLCDRSTWFGYLESAGVDNWSGYDYATEMQREDNKGEDE